MYACFAPHSYKHPPPLPLPHRKAEETRSAQRKAAEGGRAAIRVGVCWQVVANPMAVLSTGEWLLPFWKEPHEAPPCYKENRGSAGVLRRCDLYLALPTSHLSCVNTVRLDDTQPDSQVL